MAAAFFVFPNKLPGRVFTITIATPRCSLNALFGYKNKICEVDVRHQPNIHCVMILFQLLLISYCMSHRDTQPSSMHSAWMQRSRNSLIKLYCFTLWTARGPRSSRS